MKLTIKINILIVTIIIDFQGEKESFHAADNVYGW